MKSDINWTVFLRDKHFNYSLRFHGSSVLKKCWSNSNIIIFVTPLPYIICRAHTFHIDDLEPHPLHRLDAGRKPLTTIIAPVAALYETGSLKRSPRPKDGGRIKAARSFRVVEPTRDARAAAAFSS
ncbi:hypothetical protein EVAR_29856_1 [Eumeta japonica]|uniref:Uncharacterized protein n=1 Tax=Eumeta variegata TaxID=151549 RepID=A0A4C1VWP3_EUMVA|nr:hypothetical protein EVAR_29856_1 [Eumeta japonica]